MVMQHTPDPGCGHVPTLQIEILRAEGTDPEVTLRRAGLGSRGPGFWMQLCMGEIEALGEAEASSFERHPESLGFLPSGSPA